MPNQKYLWSDHLLATSRLHLVPAVTSRKLNFLVRRYFFFEIGKMSSNYEQINSSLGTNFELVTYTIGGGNINGQFFPGVGATAVESVFLPCSCV